MLHAQIAAHQPSPAASKATECPHEDLVEMETTEEPELLEKKNEETEKKNEETEKKNEKSDAEVKEEIIDELRRMTVATKVNDQTPAGKLRIWDFGGQTEFYTTHHMFLEADPLNILVLDMSKDLKAVLPLKQDLAEGIPTTQEEFLFYWLKTIEAKSVKQQTTAQVVLVLTHRDLIPSDNQEKYTEEYQTAIQNAIEQLEISNSIRVTAMYAVDNKGGTEAEFTHLRGQLTKVIQDQRMKFGNADQKIWGVETPLRWLKLEADLITQFDPDKAKKTRHMPREEVKKIGAAYGIQGEELDSCLAFYHMMGDFVHYAEEKLKEVIILDPQWLVDVFKALITPAEFANRRDMREDMATLLKNGTTTEKSLHKFWPGSDVNFLTKLLMKFNLILPLKATAAEERRFLIPCMMPRREVCLDAVEPFVHMTKAYHSESSSGFKIFPIGTFSKLIAAASQTWPICEDDHLSFGYASFEVEDGVRLALTYPHGSSIQANISFLQEVIINHPLPVILKGREQLEEKLSECEIPKSRKFQLLCPHWIPGEKDTRLVEVRETEDSRIQPVNPKFRCHKECPDWEKFKPGI